MKKSLSKGTGSTRLIGRRQFSLRWRFLTVGVVVASMIAALIAVGRSENGNKYALSGGSPYPFSELLADSVATSLPANYHSVAMTAIADIPSHSEYVSKLDGTGVSVSYDGVTYSNQDIAGGEMACMQAAIEFATTNAYEQNLDPTTAVSELESSSYCLDETIAEDVLNTSLEQAAINSGNGASLAQAQAYAQQQLANYESTEGTPSALQLGPGQTLQSVITCPTCIVGYQNDLNIQYETESITGSTTDGSPQNTEILNWFSNVLQNASTLSIENVPSATAANLPSFLPIASGGQAG